MIEYIENQQFWNGVLDEVADCLYPHGTNTRINNFVERNSPQDWSGCDITVTVQPGDVPVVFQVKDRVDKEPEFSIHNLWFFLSVSKFNRYFSNENVGFDYVCFGSMVDGVAVVVDYYAMKDLWQNCGGIFSATSNPNCVSVPIKDFGNAIRQRKTELGIGDDYTSVIICNTGGKFNFPRSTAY